MKKNWYRLTAILFALFLTLGVVTNVEAGRVKGVPPQTNKIKITVKGVPDKVQKQPATPATRQDSKQWNFSDYREEYGPIIRIGLARNEGFAKISAYGNFSVYDGNRKWRSYQAGTQLRVGRTGDTITVNGARVGKEVYIRSDEVRVVTYDNKPYRGVMKIIPTPNSNGITVINELGLESYLYGVVPSEMPPQWEDNALRAQAVAARTYAMTRFGTYDLQGFDMLDTASQEYRGMAAESPKSTAAVNDTRGEVLTYNGRLIDALFCTNAGGYTENSEDVWYHVIPYLRAVPEPTNDFTAKEWKVTVSMKKLEELLAAAGKDVGKIKKIRLSELKKPPQYVVDRSISGRVKEVTFVGKKRTLRVKGTAMRDILGLRSTMFDIRKGKKKDEVEIFGYGYGHGVGMSQWGAQIMAQKGTDDPKFYQKILLHYYKGVKLEKVY